MKERIVSLVALAVVIAAGVLIYRRGAAPPAPEAPEPAGTDAPGISVTSSTGALPFSISTAPADTSSITPGMKHLITLKTSMGAVTFGTYDADAPKTVENFVTLARKGFYDGLTFHRVIQGFMVQGGDPNCTPSRSAGPCGAGGPGYQFEDELDPQSPSGKAGYEKGVVAMANAGPDTNGSQFFIMLEQVPLDYNYTIFGKVVSGQEVVDKIGAVRTGAADRPVETVTIEKVTVEEVK